MVAEIEQIIARFRDSGYAEVASDLTEVLEEHRDFLPPQLPQEELILEDDKRRVVITRQMVEDPNSLTSVLGRLLRIPPRPDKFSETGYLSLLSRTKNTLSSYAHPFDKSRALSLGNIMAMSDDELLIINNFGVECLRLFRRATLPVAEKFFGQTTSLPQ